jgi:FtsP/CotA-like multicopper oxidase with cupredoxin domain
VIHLSVVVALIQATLPAASHASPKAIDGRSAREPSAPVGIATENDNRQPAGDLRDGVLTVRIEARPAEWRPEAEHGRTLAIFAFAEEGRKPTVPGPLIRVREGSEVRAFVSNHTGKPLLMRGLQQRPLARTDSVDLAPGETREFRFLAGSPGTYYYFGRTEEDRADFGSERDSQLAGAIVVDPTGSVAPDRVFVISSWFHWIDTARVHPVFTEHYFVNGRSWPYTEQIRATVGDTLRWRIVNATGAPHPLHLHGFYFNVLSRGTAIKDTVYQPGVSRKVVTELMRAGTTMSMSWIPERPGNWLFHCHLGSHVAAERRVDDAQLETSGHANHALEGMAALVVGIHVMSAPTDRLSQSSDKPKRRLSLFVNERAKVYGPQPGYAFVLQKRTRPPADSIAPGSPIILTKGQLAEITVFNQTQIPVSIHWHGIELESFYDGVPGWSGGGGGKAAPAIQPGKSFVVRMTPPRSGTFIYHTHDDSHGELCSGMYGPLIVLNPGEHFDTETDRIFVMGSDGPGGNAPALVNGMADPPALRLTRDTAYRFRFIDITPDGFKWLELLGADGKPVKWRALAKDGADLPAQMQLDGVAHQLAAPGETFDFAFTPTAAETLTLQITTYEFPYRSKVLRLPVMVR